MKAKQTASPKYWIVHNKNSDDVLISTASKSYDDAVNKFIKKVMEESCVDSAHANEVFHSGEFEVILCAISNVEPFCKVCNDTGEVIDQDELVWKCPNIHDHSHEHLRD